MACDNTTEIGYCDESYPVYIQIMYIYVLSVLIVVGLSGNFVSLLVFEIQRRNKGSKTLGLLICLAVADSLFLSSNIFSRMLPTISKYVYLGQELAWSVHIRPYFTAMASIFQAFAAYMVFAVTLHRYLIITKPLVANIWMSGRKMVAMVLGLFLFSVGFNIPRFFELHVVTKCNECLGVYLPTQRRTELGENIYFNIIYTIALRTIFRGLIPIVTVLVLTWKLVKVSLDQIWNWENGIIIFIGIIIQIEILLTCQTF